MLLKKKHYTVVYLQRSKEKNGWYYEFVPHKTLDTVCVNVYPKKHIGMDIQSLYSRETYYVVDPGTTTDSSNKSESFRPKLILVRSPNERHWGKNEFAKLRGDTCGLFCLCLVWSLEELMEARPFVWPSEVTEDMAVYRYSRVGGAPGVIF